MRLGHGHCVKQKHKWELCGSIGQTGVITVIVGLTTDEEAHNGIRDWQSHRREKNPFPLSISVGRKQKLHPCFSAATTLCTPSRLCYSPSLLCSWRFLPDCVSYKYMHARMTAFQEPMHCNNSHFLFINHFSNIVKSRWSLAKDWIINPPAGRKYWGGPFHSESFAAATHPGLCHKGHTIDESTRSGQHCILLSKVFLVTRALLVSRAHLREPAPGQFSN